MERLKQKTIVLVFCLMISSFGLFLILNYGLISVKAQNIFNTNQNTPSLAIDQQAKSVELEKLSQSQLEDEKNDLSKKRVELEKIIAQKESSLTEIKTKIIALEKNIDSLRNQENQAVSEKDLKIIANTGESENLKKDGKVLDSEKNQENITKQSLQKIIDSTAKEILAEKNKQVTLDLELSKLQGELQAVSENLNRIENAILIKQKAVQQEVEKLRNNFFWNILEYLGYAFLILICFLLFNFLHKKIDQHSKISANFKRTASIILTVLTILISLTVFFYAFLGNLSLIFTFFGFFSAALVVALQDFVSSFVAWMLIRSKNQFSEKDVITVNTPTGPVTGQVIEIGLFRTGVKEKIGGEGADAERFTGRTVYFPNNIVLKHPVSNFNFDNPILWHQTDVHFRYGDNFLQMKSVLEVVMHNYFEMAIKRKYQFLDRSRNIRSKYQPKIYTSLEDTGPKFTIWFPARVSYYREALQYITEEMLIYFYKAGIDIGYPTEGLYKPEITTNFAQISEHQLSGLSHTDGD